MREKKYGERKIRVGFLCAVYKYWARQFKLGFDFKNRNFISLEKKKKKTLM